MFGMRRRQFITLLGGAVAWPMVARAQQGDRVRRIGVLLGSTAPERPDVAWFLQALQQLGWSEGRNLQIEYWWGRCRPAATCSRLRPCVSATCHIAEGGPLHVPGDA
jgi:hypothetical protein